MIKSKVEKTSIFYTNRIFYFSDSESSIKATKFPSKFRIITIMDYKHYQNINWLKFIMSIISLITLILLYYLLSKSAGCLEKTIELILQLIPNLVATLLIVIVIYYVFIRKEIDNNDLLANKVANNIYEKLSYKSPFISYSKIREKFDLKMELETAKSIDFLGYSFVGVFSNYQNEIEQSILNGTIIRIVIIKPNSNASQLIEDYMEIKEMNTDQGKVIQRINQIIYNIKKKNPKALTNLEIKYTNWIPSCSMIITDKETNKGKISLKVYAIDLRTDHSKVITGSLIYKSEEKEIFDYFCTQFEMMFSKAELNLS